MTHSNTGVDIKPNHNVLAMSNMQSSQNPNQSSIMVSDNSLFERQRQIVETKEVVHKLEEARQK